MTPCKVFEYAWFYLNFQWAFMHFGNCINSRNVLFFHPLIILFESSSGDRWIIGRLPRRRRFLRSQKEYFDVIIMFISMGSRIESTRENGRWRKMETDENKVARRKEVNATTIRTLWLSVWPMKKLKACCALAIFPHTVTAVHVNIQLWMKIDYFVWSILQIILKHICKFWEDFALL